MKISILCSSISHPVYAHLKRWQADRGTDHDIELRESSSALSGGDLLFLISCSELIGPAIRSKYRATLVIHASGVPKGRGWSPLIWQVIEGRNRIPVTLMDAADPVDSGDIWKQCILELEGHELYDEINEKLFAHELQLMDFAVNNASTVRPTPQPSGESSYYRKRTPEDSRIDVNKSIADQFELLRTADPDRYPAFFDFRGHRYCIKIAKMETTRESGS